MNVTELKGFLKSVSNFHHQGELPNYFVFSMPRSGSTWLMELLATQPGFKFFNEPLYLVNPLVRKYLGIHSWNELYEPEANEKYKDYFGKIIQGKIGFLNPNPFTPFYRMQSSRVVFKVIHAGEDRINWFRDTFNGKIIYLVRHPISVSISRKKVSNLEANIYSSFKNNFTPEQLQYAERILKTGSLLQKSMVSWCMRVSVPFRQRTEDWAFITYEQMVLEPEKIIKYLVDKIDLVDPDKIVNGLFVPSGVKRLSTLETQQLLEAGAASRERLISKWKKRITDSEENELMEMLKVFDLDIYRAGSFLPSAKYLI